MLIREGGRDSTDFLPPEIVRLVKMSHRVGMGRL